MSAPVTSYWRIAGMSYLQYVNRAATSLRGALKEPAQVKVMPEEKFSFKKSVWEAGNQGPKVEINVLEAAGK